MEYRPGGGHRFVSKQPLFGYFDRFEGGGDTSIRIDIGKADFPLLLQSMTEVDHTAALRGYAGRVETPRPGFNAGSKDGGKKGSLRWHRMQD